MFGRAAQDIEEPDVGREWNEDLDPDLYPGGGEYAHEPSDPSGRPVGDQPVGDADAILGDVELAGPYDSDAPEAALGAGGLDFGSLRVPMPARAQLQIEHGSGELLRAVHVLVPTGRVSLSALAAPRTSPLWRGLAQEIAESLARDGARVWLEWGRWGREVAASSKGALSRFIGVDGPRWMLYGVATGPAEGAEELADTLRQMIAGTVVTRGPAPLPVKTVLPLRLLEHLEQHVERAREEAARPATTAERPPAVQPHSPRDAGDADPASRGSTPPPVAPGGAGPVRSAGRSVGRRSLAGPAPVQTRPAGGGATRSIGVRPSWPSTPPPAGVGQPSRTDPVPVHPATMPAARSPHYPTADGPSGPAGSPGPASRQVAGHPPAARLMNRRGLPPVPGVSATDTTDTNGIARPSAAEVTWSLAWPVVSAEQVARQPAWALLSEAPMFWPHPTQELPKVVADDSGRGGVDPHDTVPSQPVGSMPDSGGLPPPSYPALTGAGRGYPRHGRPGPGGPARASDRPGWPVDPRPGRGPARGASPTAPGSPAGSRSEGVNPTSGGYPAPHPLPAVDAPGGGGGEQPDERFGAGDPVPDRHRAARHSPPPSRATRWPFGSGQGQPGHRATPQAGSAAHPAHGPGHGQFGAHPAAGTGRGQPHGPPGDQSWDQPQVRPEEPALLEAYDPLYDALIPGRPLPVDRRGRHRRPE